MSSSDSNQSATSSRSFNEVIDLVERATREYLVENDMSRVKARTIADTLDEQPQRVGRALGRLEDVGVVEHHASRRGTGNYMYWWSLTDAAEDSTIDPELLATTSGPPERPSTLSDPDDFLLRPDDLPEWLPPERRQIHQRRRGDRPAGKVVYPCPADDCDAEFDHPDGTFRHCTGAHHAHYVEVLFGDSFGRVLVELHRLHRIPPTKMRNIIPMTVDVIRSRLKDLDAFVPFVDNDDDSRRGESRDRLGGGVMSTAAWHRVDETCNWDAIDLDKHNSDDLGDYVPGLPALPRGFAGREHTCRTPERHFDDGSHF